MRLRLRTLLAAVLLPMSTWAPVAAACGGSGPGGTGMCALSSRKDAPPPLRASAGLSLTDTTILFGEGRRAGMTRTAGFATLSVPVAPRMAFETALGGFASGALRTPAGRISLGPGLVTALGLTVRALDGKGSSPLVLVGATLSGTFVRGEDARASRDLEAYDLRATVMIGKTLAGVVTPYALGRAFGGPVWTRWDDGTRVRGTDLYKYQLGAGVSAALPGFDAFLEGAPLGERNLSAGVGVRF